MKILFTSRLFVDDQSGLENGWSPVKVWPISNTNKYDIGKASSKDVKTFKSILYARTFALNWGWSGGAKVSCILCHLGVQLILAYSWARPAILVAGKGREVIYFFCFFTYSCSSFFPVPLFHLVCYLFCLFSPFLWETTQNDPQGLTCR